MVHKSLVGWILGVMAAGVALAGCGALPGDSPGGEDVSEESIAGEIRA